MDFSNLRYWLLFVGGVAAFLAVAGCFRLFRRTVPGSVHKTFLVLIGLAALGYAGVETLLAFLFVCSVAYSSGAIVRRQEPPRARRITLACAIPILFLPLVWFKYRLFIADNLGIDIAAAVPLVLPVGISFYTFQAVGFLVDSARNRTEFPSLLDFLCFESFVPQIVAGPIERRSGLLPQMRSFRFRWRTADVAWGLRYVVLGLFFKLCLGDNLALCHPADPRGNVFALWLRNVSFGLRIYFDFCGYGLSAYGLARCMGVRLTQNFAAPYAAGNITDFWRRWHRSLTNWFRDYIYFPLGGGRTRLWAANLLAVFLLSGLWHGASWNFVLWGGANGLALVIHKLFSRRLGLRLPGLLARALLLAFVFYAWMLFDRTNLPELLADHALLFSPTSYTRAALLAFPGSFQEPFVPACFLLPLAGLVLLSEALCVRRRRNPYAILLSLPALCAEIFLIFQLDSGHANEFIYFAF